MRRVVVTGLGAVTPIGADAPSTWRAAVAGESGIDFIRSFDASEFPVRIAAEVTDFDPNQVASPKDARRLDRNVLLSLGAAREAVSDARLDGVYSPDRVGLLFGTAIGGFLQLLGGHDAPPRPGLGRLGAGARGARGRRAAWRDDLRRDPRLRDVERRAQSRPARSRVRRRGRDDAARARAGGRRAGAGWLHQRARNLDAARRRGRDARDQDGLRRARVPAPGLPHEVRDRPLLRAGGGRRGGG